MLQSPIKTHKQLTLLISAVFLLTFSGAVVQKGYISLSRGMDLKVQSLKRSMGLPKRETLPIGELFFSGRDAELRIRPESLLQAILLEPVRNKYIDFFDVFNMLVMTGIVYYMFSDSTNGTVFTKKMSTGFIVMIFAIGLIDIFTNMGRELLARHYITQITHGLFTSSNEFRSVSFSYLILPALVFLMRIIPNSGLQLQKESDLII